MVIKFSARGQTNSTICKDLLMMSIGRGQTNSNMCFLLLIGMMSIQQVRLLKIFAFTLGDDVHCKRSQ